MLLVAHRTPPSPAECARLAAAGAHVFEVDVMLVRGRPAVSHFLPFGRTGLVQRDNWRFRWHTASVRDPEVVDVAAVVPSQSTVLLDIKERAAQQRRRLADSLVDTLGDRARYIVCGPRPEDLEHLRAAGFATWRTVDDRRELQAVLAGRGLADEAVSIRHTLLTDESIKALHELVPTVVAWTVNNLPRAYRLRELGVDGVTTDRLAVLRALSGHPR